MAGGVSHRTHAHAHILPYLRRQHDQSCADPIDSFAELTIEPGKWITDDIGESHVLDIACGRRNQWTPVFQAGQSHLRWLCAQRSNSRQSLDFLHDH